MNSLQSTLRAFQSGKLATLAILGFSSGLPLFLTSRTLQLWMQDAKVDLSVITLFGLVGLPYSLKFIWAPLLDRFAPPLLGPRRGWLLLSQIGLVLAIAVLGLQNPSQSTPVLMGLAITTFVIAFLSATQDIVGDAYRTDVLAPIEREAGASLWVLGYRVALFVTSFLALVLADIIPWNGVYFLMAGLMGVGIVATLRAPEPDRASLDRTSTPPTWKDLGFAVLIAGVVASLLGAVISEKIPLPTFYVALGTLLVGWIVTALILPMPPIADIESHTPRTLKEAVILPFQEFFQRRGTMSASLTLIFILLYKLGDSLVGVIANLFLREIGFSKTEIGALQGGMGLIATTVGVLVGGLVMTLIGTNRALWTFGLLQLLSNLGYYALAQIGKDYTWLVVALNIENFSAGLVTVATVAFLMGLCNQNFTTTQFALFSSLMAISRDLLSAPAGGWAKSLGWPTFFLVTIVAAIPGLLLLPAVAPWNQPRPDSEHPVG
jgi:MFS transporter, PAT family, beta-lactamase induction signal transducer AmpG